MSTVSKDIADKIIEGNGFYPGDHIRVTKIVKYQNCFNGADAYGLIYEGQDPMRYHKSPACMNPTDYWNASIA